MISDFPLTLSSGTDTIGAGVKPDKLLALHDSDQILAPEGCAQPSVLLSSHFMDRVCIFIDGSNFYHALKDAGFPVKLDFAKLNAALTGSTRHHIHTYYYNVPLTRPRRDDPDYAAKDEQCRSQQRFFNALRFIPNLTFRPGYFRRLPGGSQIEKGVDVMLATDMLTLAYKDRYDVAIVVSSDSDYVPAIEAVKFETGKIVELRQVEGAKAYDLITAASIYKPIARDLIRKCLRK